MSIWHFYSRGSFIFTQGDQREASYERSILNDTREQFVDSLTSKAIDVLLLLKISHAALNQAALSQSMVSMELRESGESEFPSYVQSRS